MRSITSIARDTDDRETLDGVVLKTGMAGEAKKRTGKRSSLRDLVQSLRDGGHGTLREASPTSARHYETTVEN